MKLKKLKSAPKCPRCKVPMSRENYTHLCDKSCCSGGSRKFPVMALGHRVYRCPKCYDLYYGEFEK